MLLRVNYCIFTIIMRTNHLYTYIVTLYKILH